jgi:hypothetical protein
MFTPGNKKLGGALIWSFGLPSGDADVCVGMTELCREHCYSRRVERLRPAVLARSSDRQSLGASRCALLGALSCTEPANRGAPIPEWDQCAAAAGRFGGAMN